MPVNTSSTGASYGKSSDPLCPLGFHPQVRWPTRCKRCFRDYKEHSDASDRKKYGEDGPIRRGSDDDSWTTSSSNNIRSGFTKSKSLDVSSEIPEWRKRMLARQELREAALNPKSSSVALKEGENSEASLYIKLPRSMSVQPEKTSLSLTKEEDVQDKNEEIGNKTCSPTTTTTTTTTMSTPPNVVETEGSSWSSNNNTANSWMSWKTAAKTPEVNKVLESTPLPKKDSLPSWKKVDKVHETPSLVKPLPEDTAPVASTSAKPMPAWKKALRDRESKKQVDPPSTSPPLSPQHTPVKKPGREEHKKTSVEFESHRATKISEELLKAKDKIRELEISASTFEKEKKSNLIKIRDLESELDKRPLQSETKKIISELQTKYDYIEKKCARLEKENDKLLNNVQNLEGELEEVQDNFREDEADEYRHIKRELELASKNCRVLQFKLKKLEKFNHDLEKEKNGLESKIKSLTSINGGSSTNNDTYQRIQLLESELEDKNKLIKKLEVSSKHQISPRRLNNGRSNSMERGTPNMEDQLLKDLKDSIERENDLKEQLSMAEEDSVQLRQQLSQVEDENESLSSQVKRLSTKAFGSNSKNYNSNNSRSDSLEVQVQLEVAEQENSSLRRKVENLLTNNLKLAKQLKDSGRSHRSSSSRDSEELNDLRIKYAEKEAENERLEARLASSDPDKSSSAHKIAALEKKISELEKSKNNETTLSSSYAKRRSEEENSNLRNSLERLKVKYEDLERKYNGSKDKHDQVQREVIAAEREKRRIEEEKARAFSMVSKLEIEVKDLKREMSTLRSESDAAKRKNRDNLVQTQEGIRVFKEQISSLKNELSDERNKVREVRESFESKVSQLEEEYDKLTKSKDESGKKIKDLEEKWAKSKRINVQRKDKIEGLEKQLEDAKRKSNSEATKSITNTTTSREFQDLKTKYDLMEEQLVLAKACLQTEKDDLERDYEALKRSVQSLNNEIHSLKSEHQRESTSWNYEKQEYLRKLKQSSASTNDQSSHSPGDIERDRFKHIIEDRDSQIHQLKLESDMSRSQVISLKKECDDLKFKLNDYEKMSKFQKVVSSDASQNEELEKKIEELSKSLYTEARDHKTEMNTLILKYDTKLDIMEEEMSSLKASCSKYRRERESYKGMLDSLQKSKASGVSSGRSSIDGEIAEYKAKYNDLSVQVQILEDELSEAKLNASKANAKVISNKSSYEIQLAELHSRINELEESALIESGRARIAGTRTKMELAWQKERDGQKKLINGLNTMARDLKSTLLEMEKERDSERLESKRKIEGMRRAFEGENEDTKKQITDLQYDLLELRDAHAKLRTTNEKLRRDRCKIEKESEHYRLMLKEKTKAEICEDKKIERLSNDLQDFMKALPSLLPSSPKKKLDSKNSSSSIDNEIAKTEIQSALSRLQETTSELLQIHHKNSSNVTEITRRKIDVSSSSSSSSNLNSSSGGNSNAPMPCSGSSKSSRLRRSFSNVIAEESDMDSNRGSRESISSNVSIPLPIPVRTRSVLGGGSSGVDFSGSNYSIRRLERETSMDRLSTGSKDSSFSTQSEWIRGDKSSNKKKTSLIGKLKKLTKSSSGASGTGGAGEGGELLYGSGSDISTRSMSTFQRAQLAKSKKKVSGDANTPYDKYFGSSSSTMKRY